MKMRGLMNYAAGPGNIGVRELEKPEIRHDDEVIIKIKAAALCGTDIHILDDVYRTYPPLVLGHEFTGEIVEMGSAVKNFKVGDRVAAEPHTGVCGYCEACRSGNVKFCKQRRGTGTGLNGGFTDYVVMPFKLLHKLPENLTYDIAALTEPMAIVVHHVAERASVQCGDFVVVCGAGPMGLMSTFVAKECGAAHIAVIGRNSDQERFKVALDMGADYIINVDEEDPVAKVMEITNGRGADLVVEATGARASIINTADYLCIGGRICVIGLTGGKDVTFKWDVAMYKDARIIFNFSSGYTAWDRALSLMANTKRDLTKLISGRFTIDEWEAVFDAFKQQKVIKPLFIPADEF